MRLLLRRTALASRRSRAAAMIKEAAGAAAARSSRAAAPAVATKKNADDARRRPSPLDLDLAAAAFSLSPSAALGLDEAGAAADASLGPRVDHLIVGGDEDPEEEVDDLASFVASRSGLSREHALALLELGAVWWCPVPPPPPRSFGARAESTPSAIAARAAAEVRHSKGRERHGRGMHLFKPRRASPSDKPPRGSYVRVHVRPKRYFDLRADREQQVEEGEGEQTSALPASSSSKVGYDAAAWARRLVALSPEFAILNKPPGVPSVPTVDNGTEHALSGAASGIAEVLRRSRRRGEDGAPPTPPSPRPRPPPRPRLKGPQATGEASTGGLAAAHRLDHGASGVLAIGRSPRFVAGFQELSKRGRVAKVYRAALAVTETAATTTTTTMGTAATTTRTAATSAAQTAAATAKNSSSLPSSSASPPPSLPRPGDILVHWAEVNARPHGAPPRTLMFDGPSEDGEGGGRKERARCELRIVSMKRVPLLPSAAEALGVVASEANSRGQQQQEQQKVWEACILLITGRTHQIRAQMAAAGFPLLGDVLYGTADYSRVEAPRKREADREAEEEEDGKEGTESEENPPPPPLPLDRPIALHATRLASSGRHALDVFGMDPAVFDAGAPWWRSGLGVEDERDLERALELRAEVEEAASAGARGGEESGNDDEGEEEETSALVA